MTLKPFDYWREINQGAGVWKPPAAPGTMAPQVRFGRAMGEAGDDEWFSGSSEKMSLDAAVQAEADAVWSEHGATVVEIGNTATTAIQVLSGLGSDNPMVAAESLFNATCMAADVAGLGSVCRAVTDAVMAITGWLLDLYPARPAYPDPQVYANMATTLGFAGNYQRMFENGWIVMWASAYPDPGQKDFSQWLADKLCKKFTGTDADARRIRDLMQSGNAAKMAQGRDLMRSMYVGWEDRYDYLLAHGAKVFGGTANRYRVWGIAVHLKQLPPEVFKAFLSLIAKKRPFADRFVTMLYYYATMPATEDPSIQYQSPAILTAVQKAASLAVANIRFTPAPMLVKGGKSGGTSPAVIIGGTVVGGGILYALGKWLFKWW